MQFRIAFRSQISDNWTRQWLFSSHLIQNEYQVMVPEMVSLPQEISFVDSPLSSEKAFGWTVPAYLWLPGSIRQGRRTVHPEVLLWSMWKYFLLFPQHSAYPWGPDTRRNNNGAIVFGYLLIGFIYPLVFKATLVDNCSFTVIRYENSSNTAHIFVHMDMFIDPRSLFHIQKYFHVCILAVGVITPINM